MPAFKSYHFAVYFPGEREAGLHAYSDEVTITLDSGNVGGEPGKFEQHMRSALAEWYDGAEVREGTLADFFGEDSQC